MAHAERDEASLPVWTPSRGGPRLGAVRCHELARSGGADRAARLTDDCGGEGIPTNASCCAYVDPRLRTMRTIRLPRSGLCPRPGVGLARGSSPWTTVQELLPSCLSLRGRVD